VAVLQEATSFSPTYSQVSGRLHPTYTYATPLLLSDIYCRYLLLRLSAITALCPHGSLPSRLRPYALTGMHLQPPIKVPPPSPSPPSQVLCLMYTIYLTRDSTAQRVSSPGAGFNPPEFLSPCGLPVSCCLATSVVRSRHSKRLVAPPHVYVCICMDSAGPVWSSLAQDLHGSGGHESGIRTVPLPGILACAAPR